MKKLLLLIISTLIFVTLLCGCDNKYGPKDDADDENKGGGTEVCEHIAVTDPAVSATCDKEGLTEGSHCSLCGEILKEQEKIDKTAHALVRADGKEPTCTEDGYTEYEYCINCEYSTLEKLPASHDVRREEGKAPTCYEDGYTSYEYCTLCDYSTKTVIPASHTLVKAQGKAASCTEDGYGEYEYCTLCPYNTKVIIPASHTLVYEKEKAPTCTEEGHNAYEYCTVCSYSTFEPILAGHKLASVDAKEPTCTEEGHNAYEYCTECDYTTKVTYPKAHSLVSVDAKAPNCTEEGHNAYEYCTECDYTTKVTYPKAHSIEHVGYKDATCYEDGHDAYEYCTVCDYSTKVVIPKGHALEFVDAKDPSCTEDGNNAYEYCRRCDYNTRIIIPGGHALEYVDAKEPTCDEAGYGVYEFCVRCDYTTLEVIEPEGHDFVEVAGKAPTCMAPGYESYTACSKCDYSTRVDLSPVEHVYEKGWSVDVVATPMSKGVRSHHCIYDESVGCGMRTDVTEFDYEYYTEGLVFTLLSEGSYTVSFPSASGEDVIIPKTYLGIPVTHVGTFMGTVKSVSFPEGITYIDSMAFYSCPILCGKVALPDTLEYIGQGAFRGEYSIDFGNSTPVMALGPFSGSTAYEVHTTSLENWFKIADESLVSILAAGGHLYIDGKLLEGEVVIPDGVTKIPRMTFTNQLHVTSVVVPASVKDIQVQAFERSGIEKVSFLGTIDQWCAMIMQTSLNGAELYVGGSKVSGEIVIPESVTEISNYLFEGQDVTSVVFHDGVTSIGKCTFMGTKISELKFPKNLKTVMMGAFSGTNITSLVIPEGVESIGWLAFGGNDLDLLVLPSTLNIEEDPFGAISIDKLYYNCKELTGTGGMSLEAREIFIGKEVRYIPSGVFKYSENIYFAEDGALEHIGPGAFRDLWIKNIVIPSYVKEIDPTAFAGCAFVNYAVVSGDAELILPDSPDAVIGNEIFTTSDGYVFLESDEGYYLIGFEGELEGEVSLPEYAVGDSGYTVIDFPVTYGVTELTVPETVGVRMHYFFEKFSGLKRLILHGTVLGSVSYGGIERIELLGRLESCPSISYNDTLKYLVLGPYITEIPYEAFAECSSLETVILSGNLVRMEYGCFRDCRVLRSVVIPESVTYMENCFSEWTYVGLAHRELTDEFMSGYDAVNVKEFICEDGKYKYVDNDGEVHLLEQIELPGEEDDGDDGSVGDGSTGTEDVGEYLLDGVHSYDIVEGVYIYRAYLGETSSGTLVLPESIDGHRYVIGYGAFEGAEWLVSVTVRGVDKIEGAAFAGCINLKEVVLEEGLDQIDGSVFYDCKSLERIEIPESVTTITTTLFIGCDKLTSVVFLDVFGWDFFGEWQRCDFCSAIILKRESAPNVAGIYIHKLPKE